MTLEEDYRALQEDYNDLKIIHKLVTEHGSHIENSLYDSLKEKIASLESANAEIARFNATLSEQVEIQAAELTRSRAEAERLTRLAAHTSFTMAIAHELKNPLAGLISHAEAFDPEDAQDSEFVTNLMATILRNALRMRHILNTMVKYGDTESGKIAHFDLSALLCDIRELIKPQCIQAGISIEGTEESGLGVMGDATNIYRAVLNIASNAISAMKLGGRLIITGKRIGNFCEVIISDTGPGIPLEHQSRIFDLFFSTKEEGHLGMGLSMALRIIKNHGGDLTFESEPGKGTTFVIKLPVSNG